MKKKDSITLSPKHGVNPALLQCPVCHKDTGIALLGKLKGDVEAPKYMTDVQLCEDCKKKYITLLIVEKQEPKPKIIGQAYIRREAVDDRFAKEDCVYMLNSEFQKLQNRYF